jgi:hypothetical protein
MGVVETAKKYLGQTEKPNNQGFNDLEYETKMIAVGFQKGQAWCSYFAELVFKEAYPDKFEELDKLFSASAVQTFKNFTDAKYKVSTTPVVGALVIWQYYENGKPGWTGHAGIVSKRLSDSSFQSIEGNTNDNGGREGYIVAEKTRSTGKKKNGLNVLGFITID